MRLSRLLLFTFLAISFAAAGAAFSTKLPVASPAGSIKAAATMLEPRSGHTATLLPNGKVLITGGMRRNQDFYRSAELYDPATGKFQPTGDMAERRVGHIASLLPSGKVLIAGGWIGRECTNSAELYDPATGKFTSLGKMVARRGDARATALANGDVLITGGDDHDAFDGHLASAEIFHAVTLTFSATGSMHHARIFHTATLLSDGRVLIVGGKGGSLVAPAEIYDPKIGTFSLTGSVLTPRYKHTAGALPDGRVLIAGGSDERDWHGNMNSAEIYDPQTGKFTATSSLNDGRFKLPDAAVQLQSGKLLVAGGSTRAEVFDPASGKFLAAAGEMSDARHFMTATQLRDGRVLLAGGYSNNPEATAQTWIYQP